jgi:hypothetical protein
MEQIAMDADAAERGEGEPLELDAGPRGDRLALHHRRDPVELLHGPPPEVEEVHRTVQRGTRGGHPDSLPTEQAVGP